MKKLLVLFAVCFPLYAQSISMPEMPSMLEMPSVSMPSTDGTFYTPTVPSFYNGSTNTANKSSSTKNTSSSSGQEETQSTSSASSSKTSSAASTNLNLLTSILYGDDYLTASDLNLLSSSGNLSTLSSLTGLSALSTTGTASASSNVLLTEILESINELKEGQKKLESAKEKPASANNVSSVLRFRINGYDLLSGLSEVYFSTPETDGSFLLTADRIYQADRKSRKETLYLLFRFAGLSGTNRTYQVEAFVMQDSENQNSLVYKLCSGGPLNAVKTGNLVVLNGNQNGVACDILLDIGK